MTSIYEGILDMLTFFLSLLLPGSSFALRAADTFYPPLNHTTYITNVSLGSYGGIFSAPADHATSTGEEEYNYCTMPHPHVDTWRLPRPVENGSVDATMVFLEYVQRHQRRTPYNILPGGENQDYNCDNIHPHLFAAPASSSTDQQQPLPVYAKTYTEDANPFVTDYVNGSCQYPQLTIGGLQDGYQHGHDLRALYIDKLGLIPSTLQENDHRVFFRSTSSPLTQGSAGGVLRGLWPEYSGPLPLYQQAESVDTINRGFPCSARDEILSKIQSTDEWNESISVTSQLRNKLADMFDATDSSDWMNTWDHFADNFQARLCNGYDLPCSRSDPSSCVSEEEAYTVFRAGDWMYNYWWRTNPLVTEYITVIEGMFIRELVRKFEAVRDGKEEAVYNHVFAHDGDIAPLLGALGIRALRWPGMASNVAFEIWETTTGEFFARVLYSGRAIETVHGVLEWVPLDRLIEILNVYVPEDIVALCG
ncbi:histidine phosphatase family protein [Aspergillus stella-maris]|uniref:histidine phosphatase family protein n=1 Tax=Aspergillus stella-maris TaxID=1810926 RepID=UPI003CCD0895